MVKISAEDLDFTKAEIPDFDLPGFDLPDLSSLDISLPDLKMPGIGDLGLGITDANQISNLTYDINPENLKNAVKVYTISDLLGFGKNITAIDKGEIKNKVKGFASSTIAKNSQAISQTISTVETAITTLDIVEKTTKIYRGVKPMVKLAVNIGGLWLNFSNTLEIAQDVLQYIFRDEIEKGRTLLTKTLTDLLSTPVLIALKNEEVPIIDEINSLRGEIESKITDYVLNFDMDDFLTLVRMMNNDLTIREEKTDYNFKYKNKIGGEFIGIQKVDNITYYIKRNMVNVIIENGNEIETKTLVDKEINGFYMLGKNQYVATITGTIEKDEVSIGTYSGEFLEFLEYNGEIVIITNTGLYYSDSLYLLHSGNIKHVIIEKEKIAILDGNAIYYSNEATGVFTKIMEVEEGEINGIGYYDEELFFTHSVGNKTSIKKIINEREFKEESFPDTNFSFYKKVSDGRVFGAKGSSLLEIYEQGGELKTRAITASLSGDVSDIDVINIDGNNYFLASAGPSIFVADENFPNVWDERFIDFEALGIKEGIISSITVDNNEVYFSSLNNILKASNNNDFIMEAVNKDEDILDWDLTTDHITPTAKSNESDIVVITVNESDVIKKDSIIYKMLNRDIYSCGKIIFNDGSKEIKSNKNIYNFAKKDDRFYHSSYNEIYENGVKLRGLEINGNVLGYATINNSLYIFSENYYYKETGKTSYVKSIESDFDIRENTRLLSGERSLLIYDKNRISAYTKESKKIDNIVQQLNENINKIVNTPNNSFLITPSSLYSLGYNERMSKDETYANGYKIDSHFSKGLGVAPFDTKSNILIYTLTNKEKYLEGQSSIFIDHFKTLMKEIPKSVINLIKNDIINNVLESGNYGENESEEVIQFIKEYITTTVASMFEALMKENFNLSTDEYEVFLERLIERLSPRGSTNITREFYFTAMDFVKNALEQTLYNMLSVEIFGIVWQYYNNHKYEWGNSINREINKCYVSLEEYSHIINSTLDEELKASYGSLMNTTIKEEIETLINGKTGEITPEDLTTLGEIFSLKPLPQIDELTLFPVWVESISETASTHYKPKQQYKYEDVIDKSSMDPIQWGELPETINKETFTVLLNILLNRVKEEMKKGINIVITEDGVPCFSCVNSNVLYKKVMSDFKTQMSIAKILSSKQTLSSGNYESIKTNFHVPTSIDTETSLKKILDNQTDIYKSYVMPFISAVIEASEEVYDSEVEV